MTVVQVRMLHVAVEELIAAIDYYESQERGLGERFERAFWDAVELIRLNPEASAKVGRDVRRRLIRRFPYGVVYSLRRDQALIVAVMHLHRRPGYWHGRLG